MYSVDQGGPVIITPINFSASGDNILIAATTSKSINVFKLFLVVNLPTILTFKDGTDALSGPIEVTGEMAIVLDHDPLPWFTTIAGNPFVLNSLLAVQVSGSIYWGFGK